MFHSLQSFIVGDILAITSAIKFLKRESFILYFNNAKGPRVIHFGFLAFIGILISHYSYHYSNSICVITLAYILLFDLFSIFVSGLAIWIENNKDVKDNYFGYQRYEVLAIFTATVLSQISALFIIKEAIERYLTGSTVDESGLGVVAILSLIIHLLITYNVENKALNKVIETSTSSWLQEHITDISEGVCHFIPSLSSLLLPRINPVNLLGTISALIVFGVNLLMKYEFSVNVDNIGAFVISLMIIATMTPLSVLSGRTLLQTCPSHLVSQIDKALRSASTFEGVLEIQKEHFWNLGFHEVVGSVHVRVRRDANEQLVLAHVTNKLLPLVQKLTIQVFKDNWTRASSNVIYNFSKEPRSNPFSSDLSDNLPDLITNVAAK
uniref:Slc30a-9 n=1 Tax=Schmidtea mediterranea TaxID=79327 RepID=A0A0H3YJG5_SCHMD|nr:slc30a-9 [Schmidtea mediterranea]